MTSFNTFDFSSILPEWPTSCSAQQIAFEQLKTALNNMVVAANSVNPPTILVSQSMEPSQAQWEAAWTGAGYTLPITPNTKLIWWNTASLTLGGWYTVIEGTTTVIKLTPTTTKGGIHAYAQNSNSTAASITDQFIDEVDYTAKTLPSASIVTRVKCDIYIKGLIGHSSTSTDPFAMDFMVNGDPIAFSIEGLGIDQGIFVNEGDGTIFGEYVLRDQPPGTYSVQMLFGFHSIDFVLSGDIVNIGGDYGIKFLSVKAVAV